MRRVAGVGRRKQDSRMSVSFQYLENKLLAERTYIIAQDRDRELARCGGARQQRGLTASSSRRGCCCCCRCQSPCDWT